MITRAKCGIIRAGGICRELHSDDQVWLEPNHAGPVTVTGRFDVTVRPDGTTTIRGIDEAAAGVHMLFPPAAKSSESATPTSGSDAGGLTERSKATLWDLKPGDAPAVINGGIMPIPGEDYSETVARYYGVPVATPNPGESSESASRTSDTPKPTPAVHLTVVVTTADSPDDVAQAIRDSLRDLRGLGQ